MNIMLVKDLTTEYVGEIIDEIEEASPEKITIYIDCNGGETPAKEILTYYVSNMTENGVDVKVVAAGLVASCALFFFTDVKAEKVVLKSAKGILHKINQGGIDSIDLDTDFIKAMLSQTKKENDFLENIYFPFLNTKEKSSFKKGGDVYLTPDKLELISRINLVD